jgi:hypothetical protein
LVLWELSYGLGAIIADGSLADSGKLMASNGTSAD